MSLGWVEMGEQRVHLELDLVPSTSLHPHPLLRPGLWTPPGHDYNCLVTRSAPTTAALQNI